MFKPHLLIAALCISAAALAQSYPFQDTKLSPEQRADDLISRLTIEEKTALTLNASEAIPRFGIKAYDWWNEALHGVGRNGSATTFPMPIAMAAPEPSPVRQMRLGSMRGAFAAWAYASTRSLYASFTRFAASNG